MRVVSSATAALDHVRRIARQSSSRNLESVLAYWFGLLADDYEGEIASLMTTIDAQQAVIDKLRG